MATRPTPTTRTAAMAARTKKSSRRCPPAATRHGAVESYGSPRGRTARRDRTSGSGPHRARLGRFDRIRSRSCHPLPGSNAGRPGIGFECRPEGGSCVAKPRPDRFGRDAEVLGDLPDRPAEVVMQHEKRARCSVGSRRNPRSSASRVTMLSVLSGVAGPSRGRATTLADHFEARFASCVAGVDQDSVNPCLKALDVAERGEGPATP